jgi:hypothetical protein
MFPAGGPGIALVLLRLVVSVCTVMAICRPDHLPSPWLAASLGLVVLALWVGLLTPIFAAMAIAAQIGGWFVIGSYVQLRTLSMLIAMALLLLGPGAYSVDGRRFGRRLLTFPEKNPPDDR